MYYVYKMTRRLVFFLGRKTTLKPSWAQAEVSQRLWATERQRGRATPLRTTTVINTVTTTVGDAEDSDAVRRLSVSRVLEDVGGSAPPSDQVQVRTVLGESGTTGRRSHCEFVAGQVQEQEQET